MNNEVIAQFQSLSRCEAIAMLGMVSQSILKAYSMGLTVMAQNYDRDLDHLFTAHKEALEEMGIVNISFETAMNMILTLAKEANDE